jgi:2-polyprenyl-6-methoxyphenol hydroxylase-like FAD-dependent oxidoreductase
MSDTVVIAGAGPTGLMLACELGLSGVDTVVLETRAEPRQDAPGMAINAGVIELLDQRGLMAPVRMGTRSLPTVHFAMLPLDATKLARHEDTVLVLQSRLERVLAGRAAELGVDIRRGHEVVAVEQDAGGVTVTARTATGEERVRARYLVGCDGRDSAVRELAGIGFPGVDPPFHGLVGDVEVSYFDLLPSQLGAHLCPSGGHYAGAPLEEGVLRVVTAEFGRRPPEGEVTLDELRAAVRRLTGTDLKAGAVRWLTRYGNPTRNAEKYQQGAVFLAGDAAHIHFPLNGQGIATGVYDAVNLGWKLAAELHGWAPADLLTSYHTERHPVGEWTCTNVRAQIELCYPPEKVAPIREFLLGLRQVDTINEHLIELVTGLGVRYPIGDHPLAGRRLPHVPLGATSVPELLHGGRGVLLDLSDGHARLPDVTGWHDRIDVVTAPSTQDIDAAAVLLRPDGHVAWAGDDGTTAGLETAVKAWFGEPRRSS